MSLKTECRDAIYNYVNEETQRNASLTGEHKEYVLLVLQLLRDAYREQLAAGATSFVVAPELESILTEIRPW